MPRLFGRGASVDREFRRRWPAIDSIEGWLVSPDQERWLFRTVKSLPPDSVIVEIGSYLGRSTCCLGYACLGQGKRVYAIDTFAGNKTDFLRTASFRDEFDRNIARCGLTSCVTAIQGWSSDISRTWEHPINMLFIDGSHRYEDVVSDFNGFFPHVVPCGIIAVHDVVKEWLGPLEAWQKEISPRLEKTGKCGTLAYGYKPRGTMKE